MKSFRAVLPAILMVALLPLSLPPAPAHAAVDVYVTEGTHNVNGRQWRTNCEPYSQTERCWTEIYATTVRQVNGRFVQRNGWVFNTLTYKASNGNLWRGNPLASTGTWSQGGRNWRTECGTALTGRDVCRSYTQSRIIQAFLDSAGNRRFRWNTVWVLNNFVRFLPRTAPSPAPATLMLPTGGTNVATGLHNPWSLVFVGNQPLFTQRDRRTISTIVGGRVSTVATISAAHAEAEGGLLGLAYSERIPGKLFVYYTTTTDNRVVSYNLARNGTSITLSNPTNLVTGIPRARAHNGGRIAIGPDGMLYIATGDANRLEQPQNTNALGGKILRVNPANGRAAAGNPFGNLVWSYGHRNVQGLAWGADGTMYASELGQNDWDELNVIRPGANYGWPNVEGTGGGSRYTDPVTVWTPAEASPSGLLWKGGNLYMASLRGQRLWAMLAHNPDGTKRDVLLGDDRFRDVVAAPDGSIWVLTSNGGGDRIIRYTLRPA